MVLPADRRAASGQSKKQKAKKPAAADGEASRLGDGQRARPPPSTCISSPLRGTARKRKAQAHRESLILDEVDEESEDDIQPHHALHASGYMRDGFVVQDEESDDAFDPPRPPARQPRRRQQTLEELGPPISRDARFDEAGLSEIHQDIIEDFVERAKRLEEDLRNRKDMRRTIFTDQQFREMAIRWTTSVTKMRSIPGIDVDKVNTFGAKFVPLVKQYHDQYREMMGDAAEPAPASSYTTTRTVSGNHDIVDLLSSDDEQIEGEDEDDEDEQDDLESSRYFRGPAAQPPGESSDVQDFYREFERLNSQAASKKGGSGSGRSSSTSWRGGGGGGGRRGFRKGGRGGARGSGGVTKRKASGSRRSSGGTSGAGGRSRGGGSARPSGGSGISLMPM